MRIVLCVLAVLQLAAAGGSVCLAAAMSRNKSFANWANEVVEAAIWSAIAGMAAILCVMAPRLGLRILGVVLQFAALALILLLATWSETMVAATGKKSAGAGLIGIGIPAILGMLALANTFVMLMLRRAKGPTK